MGRVVIGVLGVVLIVIGIGFVISDQKLTQFCSRRCIFNYMLLGMFGERGGKIAFASLWCFVGTCMLYSVRAKRRPPGDPKN